MSKDLYVRSISSEATEEDLHKLFSVCGKVTYIHMVKDAKKLFWVVSPEQAAEDIWKGIRKRKQDIYVPARWRLMMFIIRIIPSFIFRKMTF